MKKTMRKMMKKTMRKNKMLSIENNHEKRRLFLETTAQICRLSGVPQCEERVKKGIRQFFDNHSENNRENKLITSSVVYAEFLSTTVKDIVLVRDLVKEEFLDNNKFCIKLSEIHESLSEYPKIRGNRAQRIFAVTAMLDRKFRDFNSIETKRIIRFLDNTARNLAFTDFFHIKIDRKTIKIKKDNHSYLKKIGCLKKNPLQKDCNAKNGNECRHKIDVINGKKNFHDDKCLVNKSKITKCQKKSSRYCYIERFFKKNDIKKNIALLKTAANGNSFSSKFRNKSKNKRWLECVEKWDFTKNEFEFRGRKCWSYFFDMLILLECPDDAAILSKDPDFGELGKAIGRNGIWVQF